MSKTQKTWKGHPVYESPDGRVNTIDKDRYDTYMREYEAGKAREKRRGTLAKTADTPQTTGTAPTETAPGKSGDKDKQ